jgi:hypothetical protein
VPNSEEVFACGEYTPMSATTTPLFSARISSLHAAAELDHQQFAIPDFILCERKTAATRRALRD